MLSVLISGISSCVEISVEVDISEKGCGGRLGGGGGVNGDGDAGEDDEIVFLTTVVVILVENCKDVRYVDK